MLSKKRQNFNNNSNIDISTSASVNDGDILIQRIKDTMSELYEKLGDSSNNNGDNDNNTSSNSNFKINSNDILKVSNTKTNLDTVTLIPVLILN